MATLRTADEVWPQVWQVSRRQRLIAALETHPERARLVGEMLESPVVSHGRNALGQVLALWLATRHAPQHPRLLQIAARLEALEVRIAEPDLDALELPRLRRLTVAPDATWSTLGGMPQLEALYATRFTPALMKRLRALPQRPSLRTLGAAWSSGFGGLLPVEGTHFTRFEAQGIAIDDFAPLAAMTEIDLAWGTALPDLKPLGAAARLESLRLASARDLVSLEGLDAAAQQGRGLRVLRVQQCPRLEEVSALGRIGTLERLELSECPKVTSLDALGAAHRLRELVLRGNKRVEGLGPVAPGGLEHADLSGTRCDDATLEALASASGLRDLRLRGTRISTLAALGGHGALELLDLRGCSKLRDVSALASLPALRVVALGGTLIAPRELPEAVRRLATWAEEPELELMLAARA